MATEDNPVTLVQQFRSNMKMLIIKNDSTQIVWPSKLSINEIYSEADIDDAFKLTTLYVTLDLVCRFCKLCADIPSLQEIWTPHLSIINKLKVIFYFYLNIFY
jgi:hypothetical protein